jgi:DNA excision repair protein ERCC-4
MTENPIQSVLIDHREPLWMQRLQFDGAITAVTQLQCGDVWVAAADGVLLIVERKTADDLLASIADGRLFDQAAAMIGMSPWSYIAIEGTLAPHADGTTVLDGIAHVNWRWAAVQGALQTVQEMGVAVVYLSGPEEFAPFIQRLAARSRGPVRQGGPRKVEFLHPGMALLMALPGIGPDRAKSLMEQAGSAAFALCAMTDDMLNVIGIGAGTRGKVREALGLPADSKLEIVSV